MSRPLTTGFFDLGFTGSTRAGSRVQQVDAGSPAARAGLRAGDELLLGLNAMPIYGSFTRPVVWQVRCGPKQLTITYQPRTGRARAWEWVAAAAPRAGN